MIRAALIAAALLLLCAPVQVRANSAAQTQGAPQPDASLQHDRHEGLSVSADAYSDPARAKDKFGKSADPLPLGILPVEVFLRNETDQPMHIDLSTIQLDVHPHNGARDEDIDAMSVHDVAASVAHPHGPSAPEARRFPVGIGSQSDKKADKVAEVLEPLVLDADVVPPHAMIHGFLFFDLGDDMTLAQTASIYVPDVTLVPSQKPLMFFEVPVGKEKE
ncbi:MAG TPA: hypothetical protein VMD78_08305 [Candidatus Baltobacteraceae bacterium]|nr:hypothetical protein [Candidatus Baltobacteraceae bacterium]